MMERLADRLIEQPKRSGLIILAVALAVRLLGIASRAIWYDEAFSILFSEKGPAAMVHGTLTVTGTAAADVHPLGYYTLLWLWMKAFGESVVAVRMLSIVAGLGVVLMVMLLARALFSTRTALVASTLAALAPFQIHYAQEMRMYVFLCLWLLLATYCYWRGSETPHWGWVAGFGVCAALAQYSQNLAAFYLLALAAWPVITRSRNGLRLVAAGGTLALLLYLPWLIHLPAQFAKVQQGYWVARPEATRLLVLPVIFVANLPVPDRLLGIALFVGLAVAVLGLYAMAGTIREKTAALQNVGFLLYLAVAPALLMFVISQWRPVYLERALLPSGAIFCIWLAWTLTEGRARMPFRMLSGALILVGYAVGMYVHLTNAGGIYGPFQAVVQELERRREPGDVIVHSNKLSMLPAVYFDRSLPQTYIMDPPNSAVDTLAPATQEALGLMAQPDLQTAIGGAQRVWYVVFGQAIADYQRNGYPNHPDIMWLEQHFSQVEEHEWGTLRVFLFSRARAQEGVYRIPILRHGVSVGEPTAVTDSTARCRLKAWN